MFLKRCLLILFIVGTILSGGCAGIEVNSIRNKPWPNNPAILKGIAVGFFEFQGQGSIPYSRLNFYESLAYSLVERDFRVQEYEDVRGKIMNRELPIDRTLSQGEISRLGSILGSRLYLQGNIQEHLSESVLEETYQVMINVNIHETSSGEKLGEIKLFAADIALNTGRETLDMSRKIAARLSALRAKPGKKF